MKQWSAGRFVDCCCDATWRPANRQRAHYHGCVTSCFCCCCVAVAPHQQTGELVLQLLTVHALSVLSCLHPLLECLESSCTHHWYCAMQASVVLADVQPLLDSLLMVPGSYDVAAHGAAVELHGDLVVPLFLARRVCTLCCLGCRLRTLATVLLLHCSDSPEPGAAIHAAYAPRHCTTCAACGVHATADGSCQMLRRDGHCSKISCLQQAFLCATRQAICLSGHTTQQCWCSTVAVIAQLRHSYSGCVL